MTTSKMRLAMAGFGNVGRAVAGGLESAAAATGCAFSLVGVSDPRYGVVVDPTGDGLDVSALNAAAEAGSFSDLAGARPDLDTVGMLGTVEADTLVELSYTDLQTGEPARSHIRAALERGIHVSTTNKGPIALDLDGLEQLAASNGAILAYEGTVMSGTPAVAVARDTIRVSGFQRALGILNGTTNFILGRMEAGLGFDDALAEAQHLGYAEADPSGDVEGHDAAAKLVILARVLTGQTIPIESVTTSPLSDVDTDAVAAAATAGRRWKYVAALDATGGELTASVRPIEVAEDHPLWGVGGATNALTFETSLLGPVTVVGAGAGRSETAVSVFSDLARMMRR